MANVQHEQKGKWRTVTKEIFDILQAIFTIGAIVAAGYWFTKQQLLKPQVKLEQTISQRPLAGKPGFNLIVVDVRASNIGRVRVHLKDGKMGLTQINPVPGEALLDVPLKDLELDPGEGDQALFKTVIVPDYVHTVEVKSTYGVPGEKNYYWNFVSAADLGSTEPQKTSATSPR